MLGKEALALVRTLTTPACEHAREDHQAFAPHVHREEALIHDQLVRLPSLAVERQAMLARAGPVSNGVTRGISPLT